MTQVTRRTFNALMTTFGTGLLMAPQMSRASGKFRNDYSNNMGLQLWSIFNLLQSDREGTLAEISKMGFTQVELAMFTKVGSIAPIVSEFDLKTTSCHFPFACITGNRNFYTKYGLPMLENYTLENVIDDATKYGVEHLVMPYLFLEERGGLDDYKKVANQLNMAGEKCNEAGIQLNYHNHQFEFLPIDGVLPFDVLVAETDENLVSFQIDVYFVYAMGIDPSNLIKSLGARVKLLHLKDMNRRNANSPDLSVNQPKDEVELRDETVALGSGLLDFESILKTARKQNIENCYIEVEGGQSNSLAVLKESIDHLKDLNL